MVIKKVTKLQTRLAEAYFSYEKMLLRHAFSKTGDQFMSENMVQQTFMKTWLYLVKEGKIDFMKAFLYHILRNLIVDQYRKPKTTSLDTLLEKNFEPRVNNPGRLIDIIDGKAAMLLINDLPEKYKKIMQMRYVQDLSLKEIHLVTGQSKNALAVQTFRGLEKLKLLYGYAPVI